MGRVISGQWRGLRLDCLEGQRTRPTSDRCKEALFSMIQADLFDARFLDLFAGTGQIGIEALSRQAQFAAFVEGGKEAQRVLQKNLDRCQIPKEKGRLYRQTVEAFLRKNQEDAFDIIFADPPYDLAWAWFESAWETLLSTDYLKAGGLLILESAAKDEARLTAFLQAHAGEAEVLKSCRYGAALLSFWRSKN